MIERLSQYSRYEHILKQCKWTDSADVREKFALISRRVRLSRQDLPAHEQVIWDTGANVIGPLYVAFVWWILKRAQEDGVKRLYFMARDGKILKEIADVFISKGIFEFETRDLYISRASVLYPSITQIDDFGTRLLMRDPVKSLPIKIVLRSAGISFDDVKAELSRYNIKNESHILSFPEKLRFRSFFKDPRVEEIILERIHEQYEPTIAYLKGEGLSEDVPYAFVDVGWRALSQCAISRMLDKDGCYPSNGVRGYYLGTNWLMKKYKIDKIASFLFDPSNMFWRMASVQYELFEIFADAPDGRTLCYAEKENGRVDPVFDNENEQGIKWGIGVQRLSVLIFAKEIIKFLSQASWKEKEPNANIRKVFAVFCNFPSPKEAEVYGSFRHGADLDEKNIPEVSPIIQVRELLKISAGYYWVQGVFVRSKFIGQGVLVILFGFVNVVRHFIFAVGEWIFCRH